MFWNLNFIFRKTVVCAVMLHHNCIYNHLPEDELPDSKHVEDIKNLKLKY